MIYPIDKIAIYSQIEPLELIHTPFIFGILFYFWFLSILFLAFLGVKRHKRYLLILSLCIYSLVFQGFWLKFTTGSLFGQYSVSQANYILSSHVIPFNVQNFFYRGYPMLDILTASSSLITNTSVFSSSPVLLVLFSSLFTVMMFLVYERILHSEKIAWLGVILLITGDQIIAQESSLLWGATLSFPLLALLLLISLKYESTVASMAVTLITFVSLSITYFPAPALFMLFLLIRSIITRKISKEFLALVILLVAANIYLSVTEFGPIVILTSIQISHVFANPLQTLSNTLSNPIRIASTGLVYIPLWAQVIQPLWVLILIPIALGIFLKRFAKGLLTANRNPDNAWLIAGIIATVIGGLLGGFAIPNGSQLVYRLTEYIPLFSLPAMLMVIKSLPSTRKTIAIAVVLLLVVGLSLPSFYVYHKQIGENIDNGSSQSAISFIAVFKAPGSLTLYSSVQEAYGSNLYYLPTASYVNEGESVYLNSNSSTSQIWNVLDTITSHFISEKAGAVFYWTPRMYYTMESIYAVAPSASNWSQITNNLNLHSDMVFSSGDSFVYYS
jgi:hypothetical protein